MPALPKLKKAVAALNKHALTFPETREDFPWGHSAIKVKGKIFLSTYLDEDNGVLSLSVKLPISNIMALTLPFASPTRYGLAKSGWVTSRFSEKDDVPVEMIMEWIDESFRAVAPKRVVSLLEADDDAPTPAKSKRNKKKSTRRRS